MAGERRKARLLKRPEVFWVVLVAISAGMLFGVVGPAWREHGESVARLREIRAAADQHERYLEDLRRTRRGFEDGDALLWEAIVRDQGMIRPGEVPLRPPPNHPGLLPR